MNTTVLHWQPQDKAETDSDLNKGTLCVLAYTDRETQRVYIGGMGTYAHGSGVWFSDGDYDWPLTPSYYAIVPIYPFEKEEQS